MLPDLYPSIHQACCLFEALHAPLHDGEQSELRWSSPDTRGAMRRKFFASTEAAAREVVSLGVFCDVYVGVAPRWGSDGTGVGVRRWLGQGLGGDPVWDRARILRVPSTFNHKYEASRPVEPECFEPRLRYDLDQLEEMAKAFPEEGAPEGVPTSVPTSVPTAGRSVRRDALAAPILTGERNVTLASVAGSLRDRGLDEGTIGVVLLEVNRLQCNPPLEETEVLRIARSVGRYAVGSPRYRSSPVRRVRRNAEEV
jgi:hypothetical protein